MNSKVSRADRRKWLKNKGKTIIGYKVVYRLGPDPGRYTPYYFNGEFNKENAISHEPNMELCVYRKSGKNTFYSPYFHFFETLEDTEHYLGGKVTGSSIYIIKCRIPKNRITDLGYQYARNKDLFVIIAKEFSIIKEVK